MRLSKKQLAEVQNKPATRRIFPTAIIGIDPGANTALAVFARVSDKRAGCGWPVGEGWVYVETLDFWAAHDLILKSHPPEHTVLVIENGGLNSGTHHRADLAVRARLIGRYGVSDPERERRAQDKASQRVGAGNEHARLLLARFRQKGYYAVEVKPTSAKLNRAEIEKLTGYSRKTNEHERDAIRLAHNNLYLLRVSTGIEVRI